ncbi:MAG: cysteine hydrolase [Firmicutes bacterium]|nr:cysteine hydrolase [Bacillota bacterium]
MEALIVIDMQNDFIDGSLGTPEAQAIVENVVKKINEFDGDVIYTRDTHGANYLQTAEGKRLPVEHCIKDSFGWQIETRVFTAGKEKCAAVIDKPTFGSQSLAKFIKEKNYSKITIVGLCTDICVISNALCIKSAVWETPMAVDSSCCAGVTPESHKTALKAMEMCQIDVI